MPNTPAWRARARIALEREGMTMADLARRIGVKKSPIKYVFDGRSKTSALIAPISRELGISRPGNQEITERTTELADLIEQMSPENYALFKALAQKFLDDD